MHGYQYKSGSKTHAWHCLMVYTNPEKNYAGNQLDFYRKSSETHRISSEKKTVF